jgi:hypothetical protein
MVVVTLSQQEEKKDLERGAEGSHSFSSVLFLYLALLVM